MIREEPLYVAYRIDLKNKCIKEFYSTKEVSNFFKIKESSVAVTAYSSHKTGKFREGQKWLLFYRKEKHCYIQRQLNEARLALK